MSNSSAKTSQWQKGVAESTKKLAIWTGAWVVSVAVATFGSILVWDSSLMLKLASISLNFAIGIGTIRSNIRHLKSLDELMQRVHLEAMGMALGLSVVTGISLSILASSEVIPFKVDVSIMVAMMGLIYGIGTFVGMRRYK